MLDSRVETSPIDMLLDMWGSKLKMHLIRLVRIVVVEAITVDPKIDDSWRYAVVCSCCHPLRYEF